MLEDNLRLKQKIKIAKDSALKLINKIRAEEGVEGWHTYFSFFYKEKLINDS